MKNVIYIAFFIIFLNFIGCKTNNVTTFGGSFNEENYIWEYFQFPTNRVMDKR